MLFYYAREVKKITFHLLYIYITTLKKPTLIISLARCKLELFILLSQMFGIFWYFITIVASPNENG